MAYGLTVRDSIDHIRNWLGGEAGNRSHIQILQGVLSAYRDLTTWREWKYLIKTHRIQTNGPYNDGFVYYDASSKILNLSGGVWPEWAGDGEVWIGNMVANCKRRLSDAYLLLDENMAFTESMLEPQTYTLTHSVYTLPEDFQSADEIIGSSDWFRAVFVQPRDWLTNQRVVPTMSGPTIWTVMGDRNDMNKMGLYLYPSPPQAASLDLLVRRKPRELSLSGYEENHSAGLVSGSSGDDIILGADTQFDASLVGGTLRISRNATDLPGPRLGPNPYLFESRVLSVDDASTLHLNDPLPLDVSGFKYVVSDPIDIDPGMTEAFLRGCERMTGIQRRARNIKELDALYRNALYTAEANDAKSAIPRVVGPSRYVRTLSDYPLGEGWQ